MASSGVCAAVTAIVEDPHDGAQTWRNEQTKTPDGITISFAAGNHAATIRRIGRKSGMSSAAMDAWIRYSEAHGLAIASIPPAASLAFVPLGLRRRWSTGARIQ